MACAKGSRDRQNNKWESGHPCLVPRCKGNEGEIILPVMTDAAGEWYNVDTQKGGREGGTTRTQKSLLYTITYIQQKTLPSINGQRPGPTDSRSCTFTRHYLQEATDPVCFSTHVWCKPVLYYCRLRSCKTSKQHSLLH